MTLEEGFRLYKVVICLPEPMESRFSMALCVTFAVYFRVQFSLVAPTGEGFQCQLSYL